MDRIGSAISDFAFGRREYPHFERETTGMLQGAATSIRVKVWTEGYLYPFAHTVEDSYIMISVTSDSDPNLGEAPVAVLPPLRDLRANKIPWESYVDTSRRVSEVLPLLS